MASRFLRGSVWACLVTIAAGLGVDETRAADCTVATCVPPAIALCEEVTGTLTSESPPCTVFDGATDQPAQNYLYMGTGEPVVIDFAPSGAFLFVVGFAQCGFVFNHFVSPVDPQPIVQSMPDGPVELVIHPSFLPDGSASYTLTLSPEGEDCENGPPPPGGQSILYAGNQHLVTHGTGEVDQDNCLNIVPDEGLASVTICYGTGVDAATAAVETQLAQDAQLTLDQSWSTAVVSMTHTTVLDAGDVGRIESGAIAETCKVRLKREGMALDEREYPVGQQDIFNVLSFDSATQVGQRTFYDEKARELVMILEGCGQAELAGSSMGPQDVDLIKFVYPNPDPTVLGTNTVWKKTVTTRDTSLLTIAREAVGVADAAWAGSQGLQFDANNGMITMTRTDSQQLAVAVARIDNTSRANYYTTEFGNLGEVDDGFIIWRALGHVNGHPNTAVAEASFNAVGGDYGVFYNPIAPGTEIGRVVFVRDGSVVADLPAEEGLSQNNQVFFSSGPLPDQIGWKTADAAGPVSLGPDETAVGGFGWAQPVIVENNLGNTVETDQVLFTILDPQQALGDWTGGLYGSNIDNVQIDSFEASHTFLYRGSHGTVDGAADQTSDRFTVTTGQDGGGIVIDTTGSSGYIVSGLEFGETTEVLTMTYTANAEPLFIFNLGATPALTVTTTHPSATATSYTLTNNGVPAGGGTLTNGEGLSLGGAIEDLGNFSVSTLVGTGTIVNLDWDQAAMVGGALANQLGLVVGGPDPAPEPDSRRSLIVEVQNGSVSYGSITTTLPTNVDVSAIGETTDLTSTEGGGARITTEQQFNLCGANTRNGGANYVLPELAQTFEISLGNTVPLPGDWTVGWAAQVIAGDGTVVPIGLTGTTMASTEHVEWEWVPAELPAVTVKQEDGTVLVLGETNTFDVVPMNGSITDTLPTGFSLTGDPYDPLSPYTATITYGEDVAVEAQQMSAIGKQIQIVSGNNFAGTRFGQVLLEGISLTEIAEIQHMPAPEVNPTCPATSLIFADGTAIFSGDTSNATLGGNLPPGGGAANVTRADAYTFAAFASTYELTLRADYDASVSVIQGTCNDGSYLDINPLPADPPDRVWTFEIILGEPYLVVVHGAAPGEHGAYDVQLTAINTGPDNDACEDAFSLIFDGSDLGLSGSTDGATNDPQLDISSPVIFYNVLNNAGARVQASTAISADYAAGLSVYEGLSSCSNPVVVPFVSKDPENGEQLMVFFNMEIGENYIYAVHGQQADDAGNFSLSITEVEPPANDRCTMADPLSILPGQATFITDTIVGATPDPDVPGADTLPTGGAFYGVPGTGGSYRGQLSSDSNVYLPVVFKGGCGDGLVVVPIEDPDGGAGTFRTVFAFETEVGEDYFILVHGATPSDVGLFTLEIESVASAPRFVRGDGNSDGLIDMADGLKLLGFLFLGREPPECLDAAHATDSGTVLDLADAVFVFGYLFLGRDAPRPPTPSGADYAVGDCGIDETPDGFGCGVESQKCAQ